MPLNIKKPVKGSDLAVAMDYISAKYGELEEIDFEHKSVLIIDEENLDSRINERIQQIFGPINGVRLGYSSPSACKRCIIKTGKDFSNETIHSSEVYDSLALVSSDYFGSPDGFDDLIPYTQEDTKRELSKIKNCLEKMLNNPFIDENFPAYRKHERFPK